MDPQPGLPVYRARVLDAVDWSTEGWCIVVLRFPELALPLVVDDLVTRPVKEVYPTGSTIRFRLRCYALSIAPATDVARIEHSWGIDFSVFAGEDEYPMVPGSSYQLYGKIIGAHGEDLLLDAGLVIGVVPPSGHSVDQYSPGEVVCVTTSKLELHRVEGDDGPEPPPLIPRMR